LLWRLFSWVGRPRRDADESGAGGAARKWLQRGELLDADSEPEGVGAALDAWADTDTETADADEDADDGERLLRVTVRYSNLALAPPVLRVPLPMGCFCDASRRMI